MCSFILSSSSDLVRKILKSLAEHKAKESDEDVAWLLVIILSSCYYAEDIKRPCEVLLENRTHFCNYKKGQDQDVLGRAEYIQAARRACEAADNPARPSLATRLKDAIDKFHEQHEQTKITKSTNL